MSHLDRQIFGRRLWLSFGRCQACGGLYPVVFISQMEDTIARFYRDIFDECHYFGQPSSITPVLSTNLSIKPNVVHLSLGEASTRRTPDICFAIEDYKTENYYLTQGLQELK